MSNHLKALLFLGNMIEEDAVIDKKHCLTVQHFAYGCSRNRNKAGQPYGATVSSTLTFTLRLMEPADGKVFYKYLKGNEPLNFSIVFNASFNEQKHLANYYDAMVVQGYVIDIEDIYDSTPKKQHAEQAVITVEVLLSKIIFKGKEINRDLIINKTNEG